MRPRGKRGRRTVAALLGRRQRLAVDDDGAPAARIRIRDPAGLDRGAERRFGGPPVARLGLEVEARGQHPRGFGAQAVGAAHQLQRAAALAPPQGLDGQPAEAQELGLGPFEHGLEGAPRRRLVTAELGRLGRKQ